MKKGKVLVLRIKTNGELLFKWYLVENDMIYLPDNLTYHVSDARYILKYKRYPVLILPEWSLVPFSPKENKAEADEFKLNSYPQKIIISAVQMATAELKKKFAIGTGWILGGLGAIIVIAIIVGAVKG